MSALSDVSDWKMLGQKLGICSAKLEEIASDRDHKNPELCKSDLLKYWLTTDSEASWVKVVTALDRIDMQRVAEDIRTIYCSSGDNLSFLYGSAVDLWYSETSPQDITKWPVIERWLGYIYSS